MSQRQSSLYSAGKGQRLKSASRRKCPILPTSIFLPNNRGIWSQDQIVQCKMCLKDFVVRAGISSKAVLSGHAGWCAENKLTNPENRCMCAATLLLQLVENDYTIPLSRWFFGKLKSIRYVVRLLESLVAIIALSHFFLKTGKKRASWWSSSSTSSSSARPICRCSRQAKFRVLYQYDICFYS